MKFLTVLKSLFTPAPRITPAEAADAIHSGEALLVDVREPGEWHAGVAASAALLPLSDLTGGRKLWRSFLDTAGGQQVLLYCVSGGRSAVAARLLAGEGFRAANVGGLREWKAAGWPIVQPGTTGRSGGSRSRAQKRQEPR
jgi:rhodanese-related sulfurtransferase